MAIATLTILWFGTSPTFAVVAGAAAGIAAQTRLLFASLLSRRWASAAVLNVPPPIEVSEPLNLVCVGAAWFLGFECGLLTFSGADSNASFRVADLVGALAIGA